MKNSELVNGEYKIKRMETIPDIFELVEAVDSASNVKSISYDSDEKLWTISYKDNSSEDKLDTEDLMDFMENG